MEIKQIYIFKKTSQLWIIQELAFFPFYTNVLMDFLKLHFFPVEIVWLKGRKSALFIDYSYICFKTQELKSSGHVHIHSSVFVVYYALVTAKDLRLESSKTPALIQLQTSYVFLNYFSKIVSKG